MQSYETHISPDASWVGEGQRLGAESLEAFFTHTPRLAVAFSGGCDSAYLLAAAQQAGCELRAYMVETAFQARFERADAFAVVEQLGIPLELIKIDVFSGESNVRAVCANSPDRCYLCKRMIFSAIKQRAAREGFTVLADGTNASDNPVRRPGFRALLELGIVSPLRRGGMSKANIRDAAVKLERELGLSEGALLSAKPSFPCLAVYVPEGETITQAALDAVAQTKGIP